VNSAPARGDGVGLEINDSLIRGVRLGGDVDGRVAAAAERSIRLHDDDDAVDALVRLRAELGPSTAPTRLATFPKHAMIQRIDITGRAGPDLNTLRSRLHRLNQIDSTIVVEDGPRRWLLLIRWNAVAMRRLEDLAERAGFVDVTVEPSPLATARIAGAGTRHLTRLVAPGDAHHSIVSNRLPVCALSTDATGIAAPDLFVSDVDVTLALFDDFMNEASLAETMGRVHERAAAQRSVDEHLGPATLELDLVGDLYPPFPDHDQRSPRRQAVALGAAVGAAGLAGPMRPVDMMITGVSVDDRFDRPWAIETIPASAPQISATPATQPSRRRRRLRRG